MLTTPDHDPRGPQPGPAAGGPQPLRRPRARCRGARARGRRLGARAPAARPARSGAASRMRWGVEANEHPPVLHTHDRFGHRLDEVEFHPAWHELMRAGVEHELHALPWRTDQPGAHVARAAIYVLLGPGRGRLRLPDHDDLRRRPRAAHAARARRRVGPAADRHDATTPSSSRAPRRPSALCGMAMTEKQGGSDVRANTTRALAGDDGWWELTGHKWFCSAPMCDLFLVLAQTDEGVTCFALPRVLPDGTRNAGFQLQRLKDKLGNRSNASSEVEFRGALAQHGRRARPRRADDHRDGQPHAPGLRDRHGGRDARGGRAGDLARRAPQRLRQAPGRPAADAQRARRPRDRVRGGDRGRPAPRARLRRGARRPERRRLQAPGHRGRQVPRLQARPGPRLRGARVPRRQRLRRGVGHAAPVPRGAAGLDLGGLGQRHGPRRPARAVPQPRGARRLLRRGRRGRGRRPAARRVRGRHARGVHRPRGASSRAPAASSSAWRCACRARCSSATRRPRWPTPSAPRAWPATRACTTARCRPASTPRRSSRGTRRRCDRSAEIVRPPAGGPAFGGRARRRRCRARWPPSAPLRA